MKLNDKCKLVSEIIGRVLNAYNDNGTLNTETDYYNNIILRELSQEEIDYLKNVIIQ